MTADDSRNLPEGQRAELIDGELWNMAAPSRVHQHVQMQVSTAFNSLIQEHDSEYRVYGAPFDVPVASGVFPGLEINFGQVIAMV